MLDQGFVEIENINLTSLSLANSSQFYYIYSTQEIIDSYNQELIKPKETELEFTKRIIGLSNYIWSIRLSTQPESIIGVCALHHWDKEKNKIEIGGTLLPEYWGMGIMKKAFGYMIDFAFNELGVQTIVGRTSSKNLQAIKMVKKLGFQTESTSYENEILMTKTSKQK